MEEAAFRNRLESDSPLERRPHVPSTSNNVQSRTMKRYLKPLGLLLLAVTFSAATFAVPPPAGVATLPIKGSIKATEDHTVTPPVMSVQLTGTGQSTLLGLYVLTADETVALATLTSQGNFRIDTESGGVLFGTVAGHGTPTDTPNEVLIEEVYSVTGGSGRFDGATGSITVNRVVDRATMNSSGTMAGTVMVPAGNR